MESIIPNENQPVSVRFGLSKGLLNKKVTAIVKEKETEEADKALVLHELLTEV